MTVEQLHTLQNGIDARRINNEIVVVVVVITLIIKIIVTNLIVDIMFKCFKEGFNQFIVDLSTLRRSIL